MTIEEIKEWWNTTDRPALQALFVADVIDTLLTEVATLEKHNASSDQEVVRLDGLLTIAIEALERIANFEAEKRHNGALARLLIKIARTALERIKE